MYTHVNVLPWVLCIFLSLCVVVKHICSLKILFPRLKRKKKEAPCFLCAWAATLDATHAFESSIPTHPTLMIWWWLFLEPLLDERGTVGQGSSVPSWVQLLFLLLLLLIDLSGIVWNKHRKILQCSFHTRIFLILFPKIVFTFVICNDWNSREIE